MPLQTEAAGIPSRDLEPGARKITLAPDVTSTATRRVMKDVLDIGDVAAATGLTHRALRFYEARGLVTPLRTAAGRRVYGPGEITRLNAVVALKGAGFGLSRIAELLEERPVDLGRIVAAQLAHVDAQADALAESRALLLSVRSRIDRGEAIDIATLCSLVRTGESIMNNSDWKPVVDDYFTPDEQERFRAAMPEGVDGQDAAKWRDLGARIEAAMPLDPASDEAQAMVDQWFALLKPFSDVATPEMWNGITRMYDNRPNWEAQPEMGFSHNVWIFIRAATRVRLDTGGSLDGPAWAREGR